MKTAKRKSKPSSQVHPYLIQELKELLELDLSHPENEAAARELLTILEEGRVFTPPRDLVEDDCLLCLDMALRLAAEAIIPQTATQSTSVH